MSFWIEGHQPAVDDADKGQDARHGQEFSDRVREEGKGEPEEAVGSHLQEDGGQDDRSGRRRFDVGIGQPGVEGEHRHLDGEGEGEKARKSQVWSCGLRMSFYNSRRC